VLVGCLGKREKKYKDVFIRSCSSLLRCHDVGHCGQFHIVENISGGISLLGATVQQDNHFVKQPFPFIMFQNNPPTSHSIFLKKKLFQLHDCVLVEQLHQVVWLNLICFPHCHHASTSIIDVFTHVILVGLWFSCQVVREELEGGSLRGYLVVNLTCSYGTFSC
jgi:hypothetical protein